MTEPLIVFEEGTPIKPGDTNDNNTNILGRISASAETLNTRITGIQLSVESAIETLTENVGSDIDAVQDNLDNICSQNGLYITYNKSTNGWYKAYYTDPEKTEESRVFVIQGGVLSSSSSTRTVTFPLAFTAANTYTILKQFGSSDDGGTAAWWVGFWSCTATTAKTRTSGSVDRWLAIGW